MQFLATKSGPEREARDQLATMRSQDHNVTLQYREKHVTVNDWTGE